MQTQVSLRSTILSVLNGFEKGQYNSVGTRCNFPSSGHTPSSEVWNHWSSYKLLGYGKYTIYYCVGYISVHLSKNY